MPEEMNTDIHCPDTIKSSSEVLKLINV